MEQNRLHHILSKIYSKSDTAFLGVFAADNLPLPDYIFSHSPCAYVANTDQTGRPGTHWVAIFHPSKSCVEFFDSFGFHPHDLGFNFSSFTLSNYNQKQVQSFDSQVCGHYCIYFLFFRIHGHSFSNIMSRLQSLSHFQSDSVVNSFTKILISLYGIK